MSYDQAGDVAFDGVNSYLYDAEGRVCAVNNGMTLTGYIYDGAGQRVAKGTLPTFACNLANFTLTNSYIYGGAGELLTEIKAGVWDHSNVYGPTGLLATYHDTNTYFALNDWQGTKRAELSAAGCFETFASLPFGDNLTSEGNCPDASEQHFTGKEHDAESGNDFFGARYYSSTMSRWLSPDWSEKAEPVPYAKLEMPQSLNLYGYVGNNPLSKVDADGHLYGDGKQQFPDAIDLLGDDPWHIQQQQDQEFAECVRNGYNTWAESQNAKAQQSVSAPARVSGTLTINTILTGDESFTDGHAWLTFTPDGGKTTTYGTYGNANGAQGVEGVNEDSELKLTPTATRTAHLNSTQTAALSGYISSMITYGTDAWSYGSPCSTFASDGWRAATGESLNPSRGGVLSTPTNLQRSIVKANGDRTSGIMSHPVATPFVLMPVFIP